MEKVGNSVLNSVDWLLLEDDCCMPVSVTSASVSVIIVVSEDGLVVETVSSVSGVE